MDTEVLKTDVFIISGCRTGIGSFMGQYSDVSSIQLGATVIEEAVKRAQVDKYDISQIIMGQVLTAGLGQNPTRQAASLAQLPFEIPAYTINMVCGSGLKAVYDGYNSIKANECSIVVCGGMENMTKTKHCVAARPGKRIGSLVLEDTVLLDGLSDGIIGLHMGCTAEHLSETHDVSRDEQDNFALLSQTKAQEAIANNIFREEIVDVVTSNGQVINKDEYIRSTSLERLSKLAPAFNKKGTVTAGNASGINDGAAALIICSGEALLTKKLDPLARIVAFAQVGIEPINMGLGPISAVEKVVEKAGWTIDSVDLFEINEAFAVQALLVTRALSIDQSKVNITGGAIALGHPIGASGARVLVTLMYALRRTKKQRGIAALCVGGGMGIAVAIQIE